jgi:excinuclease UvrABC nuclease subunit
METIKNCVYKFIDENGLVIYVGKSKNLKTRLLSHKRSPHLAKSVYAKVRQIEYISYSKYLDVKNIVGSR